jgi:ribonuclease P protein component
VVAEFRLFKTVDGISTDLIEMHTEKSQMKRLGRLLKRSDYLRVQHEGQKWVAKGLVLQILEKDEECGARFGLTVSKRTSKSAVIRNRVKRRLRAVAYDVLPAYAGNNIDYVLIGRATTLDSSYDSLKKDLIWCLGKLGVDQSNKD